MSWKNVVCNSFDFQWHAFESSGKLQLSKPGLVSLKIRVLSLHAPIYQSIHNSKFEFAFYTILSEDIIVRVAASFMAIYAYSSCATGRTRTHDDATESHWRLNIYILLPFTERVRYLAAFVYSFSPVILSSHPQKGSEERIRSKPEFLFLLHGRRRNLFASLMLVFQKAEVSIRQPSTQSSQKTHQLTIV